MSPPSAAKTPSPVGSTAPDDRLLLPDLRGSNRRRRLFIGVAIASLVVASAFVLRPHDEPPELIRTERVTRRTVTHVAEVSGHLDVGERVEVPAPMTGRLVEISVAPGDTVVAGQKLARLDERTADLAVGSARASVNAAASHVTAARVQLDAARGELDRVERLMQRGLASEADVQGARSRMDQAEASLRAARAEQGVAATGLVGAQVDRAQGEISSPVGGVILHAPRSLGSIVAPERGPLFVIGVGLDALRIDAAVGEADIGEVRVGQTARFEVPAFLGRTFSATVTRIELAPDIEQGAVSYPVQFRTENPDHALLPGMTAVMRIEVAHAENVLTVREAALRFAPAGAGEAAPRTRVWKRVGPNHLEPIAVVAGVSDGAFTEIRPVRPNEIGEGTDIAIGMRVVDEAAGAGLSLGAGRRRGN